MDAELKQVVKDFQMYRANNPDGVDLSTAFQQYVIANDVKTDNLNELSQAAIAVGIPPQQVDVFLEELASWL